MDALSALSAGTSTAAGSSSAVARQSLAEDFDNFLTLLTTQLQNQDPLSPMDSAEFTNQLVLFAGVEQQIAQNANLERMIDLQQATQMQAALSLVGMEVELPGNTITRSGGPVGFRYTLPEDARALQIGVLDSSGALVRTLTGPLAAGAHDLVWDGNDAQGQPAPDGRYTLAIGAVGAADDARLTVETVVSARVTGINAGPEGVTLDIGGETVALEDIQRARAPAA